MKKLVSIVLALALVLLCVGAAMADETYTITVNNTNPNVSINGKTYSAYKLFDVTYTGANANDPHTYSITSSSWAWNYVKGTEGANGVYSNATYGLTFTPTADNPNLYMITSTMSPTQARSLADALKSHLPTADGTSPAAANETAVITLTSPAYYLVYGTATSTDGSQEVTAALSLTTTDPTATINPKVDVPTLDKKITGEHVLDAKGQAAVAEVGTTVSFELDSAVPDLTGFTNYTFTFHDTMSSGLTFTDPEGAATNDIAVTIGGTNKTSECTISVSGQSFTVTVPFSTLQAATKGDAIVVTYSAVVNDNALTTDNEKNTAYLTYSNNPYDTTTKDTPEKKVYVIDVNIDVNKYTGADKDAAAGKLSGATFKLYKTVTSGGSTSNQYYKKSTNDVEWVAEGSADTFTTGTDGKFSPKIVGLEAGTYYLIETEAPTGYNKLQNPIEITITASHTADATTASITANSGVNVTNGTIDLSDTNAGQPVVYPDVQNQTGTELPSTGGIGTTIFYILGGLLVVGAAVILVARRKASN